MPEDEAELVAEARPQLIHDRVRLAAVGTLEVAVLDQGDGRVVGSAHVVALRIDGRAERGDQRLHVLSLLIIS